MVSTALVKALKLTVEPHPNPYKITWVMDDTMREIKEVCTFVFSIGETYQDHVTCDVMPINVCHIILARPWKYDNKAKYDGFQNTYEVQWGEKKNTFWPI